jgi:hypothetical protein
MDMTWWEVQPYIVRMMDDIPTLHQHATLLIVVHLILLIPMEI